MTKAILVVVLLALGAGCVNSPLGASTLADPAKQAETPWQRVHLFEGTLGATQPGETSVFDVPEGAAVVEAVLIWNEPAAQLAFRLLDPRGEEAARGWAEAERRAYVTTTFPVSPGEWTLEVTSARAIAADYAATVSVHSAATSYGPMETTFVIPPRNLARELPPEVRGTAYGMFARDFAEINLNMVPGDAFRFRWTASEDVYFNVHWHSPEGVTERPIEHTGRSLEGEFAATETEVYALLWRNEGLDSVEVQVEIDGSYRLHSMTRRA